MSYSAFFASGLTLASLPRTSDDSLAKQAQVLQSCNIPSLRHVHGHARSRRRRPSLTVAVATSPIKSTTAVRNGTNDAVVRTTLRSPPETGSGGVIPAQQISVSPRPAKTPRRKTISSDTARPSLPAPTQPLPRLPSHHRADSATTFPGASASSLDDVDGSAYPLSPPITADWPSPPPYTPAVHIGSLRANPSRKSSLLLPPGRAPLLPSGYAGNVASFSDEAGRRDVESTWAEQKEDLLDDYLDMRESDGDK